MVAETRPATVASRVGYLVLFCQGPLAGESGVCLSALEPRGDLTVAMARLGRSSSRGGHLVESALATVGARRHLWPRVLRGGVTAGSRVLRRVLLSLFLRSG